MTGNYLITIFTPTYNRVSLLPRLYESLGRQTNRDFVWLIVDDGSTDNTSSLVNEWSKEGKIDIKYVFQENAGKMKAHNRGVRECKTELFMCLDSDDYLSDDCIEKIYLHWSDYKDNPKVSGMVAYRKMVGRTPSFFPEVEFSTLHGLHRTYIGETALAFRSDILRQFPFPEIEGEKFIGEGIVYEKLDQRFVLAVIPEYWMICEYQDGGYTDNSLRTLINNPCGWALNARQKYEIYGHGVRNRIKWMSTYICASLFANYSLANIVCKSPNRVLCVMCLPIGWMQKIRNQKKVGK